MTEAATLVYHDAPQGASVSFVRSVRSVNSSRIKSEDKALDVIEKKPLVSNNDPVRYSYSRTNFFFPILISDIAIEGYNPNSGDEISAFLNDSLCIGALRVDEEFPIGLAIWKDDTTTNVVDGYTDIEDVQFKYWIRGTDNEIDLQFSGENNQFQGNLDNAVYHVESNEPLFSYGVLSNNRDNLLPESYFLDQNYPNPFNSTTRIKYGLPELTSVNFTVYDVQGRVVKELINSDQKAGFYSINWNANTGLASGLYIIRMKTDAFTKTIKTTLIK